MTFPALKHAHQYVFPTNRPQAQRDESNLYTDGEPSVRLRSDCFVPNRLRLAQQCGLPESLREKADNFHGKLQKRVRERVRSKTEQRGFAMFVYVEIGRRRLPFARM